MFPNQDTLTTKVEITISCRNLKDMDVFSKSDPMAVLFQKLQNQYFEVGRTEVAKNNLNPDFSKVFEVDYHFEERQLMKVEIYDSDCSSARLDDQDFQGRYEFSLGELVSRRKIEANLTSSKPTPGKKQVVILTSQEVANCKELLTVQLNGTKLDKKDVFGKSDPLIEIYRSNEPIKFFRGDSNLNNYNIFTLIYRSKPIMNTLNPSWPQFTLKLGQLCGGDKDKIIKIVCADWNSDGSQDFIGQCFTSVNDLIANTGKGQLFELINIKKQSKKKGYKNSGTLSINKALIQMDYSFIDFISGGTDLNFTVAIDFTGSNGNQTNPKSLHYVSPYTISGSMNQYETAILSIGSIIQDYDSDKMFPALGFGARIPPKHEISHCFPITFSPQNPFCSGVGGLLSTYRSAIRLVTLCGPTNFSPTIRHVQQFASSYKDGSKYFVLLIITDGIITDLHDTIEAIIDCSYLPMSIIIIGVGNEDFSAMDTLDCDRGRLQSGSKVSKRDIVQFVPIRNFIKGPENDINQFALSKAVLLELPNQVTSWMKLNGIIPLPANQNPQKVSEINNQSRGSFNTGSSENASNYPGSGPNAPAYPGSGPNVPAYPGSGPNAPGYPGSGPNAPGYPGSGPNVPNYPGSGSNAPSYPGSGPNVPTYLGSGPNAPGYPGSGPNAPAYPGSGANAPGYPGSGPNAPGYPGSGPNASTYPGSGPNVPTYPGSGPNAPAYPGSGPNAPAYPGSGPNAPAYPGSGPNAPVYPGSGPNVPNYQGSGPNVPAYSGSGANAPGYPGSGPNAPVYPGSGPNVPNYQGSGPNVPAYSGSVANAPAYPGSGPNAPPYSLHK